MVAMNVWPTDAADGSVANEARWRKMARGWQATGVNAGVGGEMAPTLAFPNLTVKNGSAWVDGHYCELLGDQVLAVTANGLAVVRFDPAANSAQLLYLDGVSVPAQSPTGIYEMPIAKITGSALTDQRALVASTDPARGRIASATYAVNQAGIGAADTGLTGLGLGFTALPGRRYVLEYTFCVTQVGAPGAQTFQWMLAGIAQNIIDIEDAALGTRMVSGFWDIGVMTPGAKNLGLLGRTNAGTMTIQSGSFSNGRLAVFDVGT